MQSPFGLLLIGAVISLVSAFAAQFFQHWLRTRELVFETRRHAMQVIYERQLRFFDALPRVLDGLNGYITAIDVWLGEASRDAESQVARAVENNASVMRLYELLEQHYMYLPEKLVNEANRLHFNCMLLSNSPDMDKTHNCIDQLFVFRNMIRQFVGVDTLSRELLEAFAARTEAGLAESAENETQP